MGYVEESTNEEKRMWEEQVDIKKTIVFVLFFSSISLVLCSIWRAGRPTSVEKFDEITLDAAKACITEQGEEGDEKIDE